MSDDEGAVEAVNEHGGVRPNQGRKKGQKGGDRIPGVRSLFGTDKAPISEEGQEWRAKNLEVVKDWSEEKNAITTALDNLAKLKTSPSAQRTILEFTLGRPVSQSEIQQNVTTPDDSAAAMNAMFEAMIDQMVENGVDRAFAERVVQQALWQNAADEPEEDDEEVFEETS